MMSWFWALRESIPICLLTVERARAKKPSQFWIIGYAKLGHRLMA
jgi:hypothetical protein